MTDPKPSRNVHAGFRELWCDYRRPDWGKRMQRDMWRVTFRTAFTQPRTAWGNARFLVGMWVGGFTSATRGTARRVDPPPPAITSLLTDDDPAFDGGDDE